MDYETADGSQFSLREIWSEDPNPTNTTTTTTTHTTKPINSPKFEHTLITAFVDGNAYAGKSLQRISAMDDVDVFGYLEPVPSENIFPIMPAEFTRAPPFDMANHYLKAPQFTYEDSRPGRTSVADRLRNEARVLEFLMGQGRRRRRMENGDGNDVVGGKDEVGGDEVDAAAAAVPHPNVVRYYGCVLKDERITHLCLQRCYCNLAEYAEVGLSSEETDELLGQVQEGLKFLHGLGLAHNDIHPGEYFLFILVSSLISNVCLPHLLIIAMNEITAKTKLTFFPPTSKRQHMRRLPRQRHHRRLRLLRPLWPTSDQRRSVHDIHHNRKGSSRFG